MLVSLCITKVRNGITYETDGLRKSLVVQQVLLCVFEVGIVVVYDFELFRLLRVGRHSPTNVNWHVERPLIISAFVREFASFLRICPICDDCNVGRLHRESPNSEIVDRPVIVLSRDANGTKNTSATMVGTAQAFPQGCR